MVSQLKNGLVINFTEKTTWNTVFLELLTVKNISSKVAIDENFSHEIFLPT